MKRFLHAVCFIVFFAGFMSSLGAAGKRLIGARFPALSPDGAQIAFSYMGDLWTVPAAGGKAFKLTDNIAYDGHPVWSPDGQWIAFTSNREGSNDVYIIKSEGGIPKRLTFHSGNDMASDFTADGHWVVFQSSRSSMSSVFKIPVKGGNAVPILDTYWSWPGYAKVSPDGKRFLFALGMENNSWWRRGYRGSNAAKIWMKEFSGKTAKMIFGEESNCFWPDWNQNGGMVYFVSDRKNGTKNIWSVGLDGSDPVQVTRFPDKDITWMSIARPVEAAVYERNFGIWFTDLKTGKSHAVAILAPAETKSNQTFFVENAQASEYRLSPDGKKIAAVVRGDIFVLSSDGGYARNITNTPWRERDIAWDKDSRFLYYVSDADANPDLYKISALGDAVPERLTQSKEDELKPRVSPDGRWLAYFRGKRQLRLIDLAGEKDSVLFEGDIYGLRASAPAWSPDSRFVAVEVRRNANTDLFAVDIQSKKAVLFTNTAYDEGSPVWSPDGKFLLFSSNRFGHSFPEFTGKWDIYQLFLEPQKTKFDEDAFDQLFQKEKKEKAKKDEKTKVKVHFNLENIDRQTKPVTNTLGNDGQFVLSPKDKKTIYFLSNIDGKYHLWTTSLDEKKRGKYEPFMSGLSSPGQLQMDAKGKYLYYLSRGKLGRIDLVSKRSKPISFRTKIEVDKTADYEQMLAELYYTQKYYYYDKNFHKANWSRLYEQFRPVLQQVREDADFYDYANMMIGHLNSSHSGIRAPYHGGMNKPSAHLGAEWRIEDGRIVITHMFKKGPLYDQRSKVETGDSLTAVDDKTLDVGKNIWTLLNGKPGKRVKLTFIKKADKSKVNVFIKPISAGAENRLRLEEWITSRREEVKSKTGDKGAYLYMRAMGRGDLSRFLKELERDAFPRQGVILDLRNNFGGNVHDRVLQALMKPVYAKWRVRGMSETPQSTFGVTQKPVVLLVNEVTLSDGEMTANGFKTLKRGPIVGNTTYGWLIFTTSVRLMNGGSFRLPFWGCYTLDGRDLETIGGVKPDIVVVNDLNDDLSGKDPQLEKAIEVLLGLLKK